MTYKKELLIKTILLIAAAVVLSFFSSCCRPATEYFMQRWEKKTKFERKVSYVKYPGKKKIKIRY